MQGAQDLIAPPELEGPENAEVTLVGWGSTHGAMEEARQQLAERGVVANQLTIKWIVPFHADHVSRILNSATKVIIVENNYSGQFARYLRSETGLPLTGTSASTTASPSCPTTLPTG